MHASFKALIGAPIVALLASSSSAQFGDLGVALPTTAEQQDAIDKATSFLSSVGEDVSGLTFTNADFTGNLPAASDPSSGTVGIDFARLEEVVPPNTPGAPGHPGCVVVLIYHELQHLRHGKGRSFCQEAELAAAVAQKHCQFIAWIVAGGGGPTDAICLMYSHVEAVANSPEQQAKVHAAGCSGNTTIPDCAACAH